MWIQLGNTFLGNFSYHVFPNFFNSDSLRFSIDESTVPQNYLKYCTDRIIVTREFSDNGIILSENCGIFYPQSSEILFDLNPISSPYTEFRIKIKKIPRYRYGLGLNISVYYRG